jgi:hypothetical protein
MSETKNLGERLATAVSRRAFNAGRYLYQSVRRLGSRAPRQLLFIFGCQRSGTTLVKDIFDNDLNARVYGEFSEISRSQKGRRNLRLKPLEEVKAIIERGPARLIVAKPIAETQNALKLLAFFPGSKALFIYRNYAAVAASNLKLFGPGNGISNLRPIMEGDATNWRAEGVSADVRGMVAARFRGDMDPYDAAALFWYVRNRFFFDLGLDRHPAVRPLRYEDLVRDPSGMMARVYGFLGMDCPRAAAALVHGDSAGKGREVKLSAEIRDLCQDLLERLEHAHVHAWAARSDAPLRPSSAWPGKNVRASAS